MLQGHKQENIFFLTRQRDTVLAPSNGGTLFTLKTMLQWLFHKQYVYLDMAEDPDYENSPFSIMKAVLASLSK